MVVGELEEQTSNMLRSRRPRYLRGRPGLVATPALRAARMLIETPADGEEIEEVEAIRVCDCILHGPGSQAW